MKVLFDQGVPVPLRQFLCCAEVRTAWECRWNQISNGELIATTESNGFHVLVTTDQNLRYQQDLRDRKIAIVVLRTTSWPRIRVVGAKVATEILNASEGSYAEIEIP